MTTDQRIEHLEKGLASARRLNCWLLAAVGLALGVWLLAGTFGPTMAAVPGGGGAVKEIRANRFVVEDENGKTRIVLAVSKDGPVLALYDENGKDRAELVAGKDVPRLALYDENAKNRVMLHANKDGPGLLLAAENAKMGATLRVDKNGTGLGLYDEKGKTRAGLGMTKDGPALVLTDENGKLQVTLHADKDGAAMALRDENGKVIWQIPYSAPDPDLGLLGGAGKIDQQNGAKIDATKLKLKNLEIALEAYYVNIGHYPKAQEGGLEALRVKPSFVTEAAGQYWRGPYLKENAVDSWGNKFNYQLSQPGTPEAEQAPYKLWSNGPDGISGTADDIKSRSGASSLP